MRELAQPQLCYLTIHLSKQITLPLSSLPRVELCELTNQKDDPRGTPSTSFDQQLKFQFFFPKPWSRRKNNPNPHNSAMTLPPHLKVMWQKVTWQLREDLGGNISFIFQVRSRSWNMVLHQQHHIPLENWRCVTTKNLNMFPDQKPSAADEWVP